MRKDKTTALIAAAILAFGSVACDSTDVFYSVEYPVQNVSALIKFETIEPEEGEDQGDGTTTENPLEAQILAEVIAQSPMKDGGRYILDFTQFDGGALKVKTTPETATTTGIFNKRPGSDSLKFEYGGTNYIALKSSYKPSEGGASKIALVVNLTKEFQTKYPDGKIVDVMRVEYTTSKYE